MASLNSAIVTYNCGRAPVRPELFSEYLAEKLKTHNNPEIIVLCLQEIAPIPYAFLGGSFLTYYYQQLRITIELLARTWDSDPYLNILSKNVGMTAILVFFRGDIADRIRWLESGSAGIGLLEMGNKGAVGARMGYLTGEGELSITFVSAHLAAMEDALDRRNQDWRDICERLVFEPVTHFPRSNGELWESGETGDAELRVTSPRSQKDSGIYVPTSHVFLAGDLNYRTSNRKPTAKDQSLYPQSQADCLSFFEMDQLTAEMRSGKTMQQFLEPPISFVPTYKYSDQQRLKVRVAEDSKSHSGGSSSSSEDNFGWAAHRWPSWCDRILYLDTGSWVYAPEESRVKSLLYNSLPLMSTSDHRPVVLVASTPLSSVGLNEIIKAGTLRKKPPYSIDPLWRPKRAAARQKEIFAGFLAYLAVTWEGNGILLAVFLGAMSGWAFVRSMLM